MTTKKQIPKPVESTLQKLNDNFMDENIKEINDIAEAIKILESNGDKEEAIRLLDDSGNHSDKAVALSYEIEKEENEMLLHRGNH